MYYKLIIGVFVFLSILSCNKKFIPSSSISASNYNQSSLVFNVNNSGNTREAAVSNALSMAFETLFFIGAPGTNSNLPLFEGKNNNGRSYFKNFMESQKYKPFIVSIENILLDPYQKKFTPINISLKVVINVESLRRFIEGEGEIRKFGF